MSLSPAIRYPANSTPPDSSYPFGSAKNSTAPGAKNGYPWEKDQINDWFGFFQAALDSKNITPSGNPDRVGASQYLEAFNLDKMSTVTVAEMVNRKDVKLGMLFYVSDRFNAVFKAVLATGVTENTWEVIAGVEDELISFELQATDKANLKHFGGVGDDSTDNLLVVGAWLDYLIANNITGEAWEGTFLVSGVILKAINNGLKIIGNGVFKASGSNRFEMFRFTGCQGHFELGGITFDGNNVVAKPFQLENENSTVSTLGSAYFAPNSKFINAKNNAPDTFTVAACIVRGGFTRVVFEGSIDGVDSSLTSGAITEGLVTDWFATAPDDWIGEVVITGNSSIKNVKNDNAVLQDADGLKAFGPITAIASLVVQPGAYFENCKGRSIKSQVVLNAINAPVIKRFLYDGLVEIDVQNGGGHVNGALISYDSVRVDNVISSTSRLNLPHDFNAKDNVLDISGTPSSNTGRMIFIWGTDSTDAIIQQGINIKDNKVRGGAIDFFATVYGTNVEDVNRVTIDGNWAKAIGTSFFEMERVFNNPAHLAIAFTNNGCEDGCVGSTVISSGQLTVLEDKNNHNITPLIGRVHFIAAGVITLTGGKSIKVETEGGAGFDDVVSITGGDYSHDEQVTFRAADNARAPKFKNGTGNIFLAGSDFELNNIRDRLVLGYDAINDEWLEISRSDNGV